MRVKGLTKSRITLLQELSRNPYIQNKEIMKIAGFKDKTYPSIVKRELTRQGYLIENNFEIDYGKLCKNKIDILYAFLIFDGRYEDLQRILGNIRSCRTPLSLVEICFSSYLVSFYSDDNKKIKIILDYLVKKGILYSYALYKGNKRSYWGYPLFREDDKNLTFPPTCFNNLLKNRSIPNLDFKKYKERLSFIDLRVISHLQRGNSNCKKIQKYEKEHGNIFSYSKLKESFRKLIKNKILEKKPYIFPLPSNECYKFVLFLRADTFKNTQKIIFNLGENLRVFKKITYVSSLDNKKNFGLLECVTPPCFFVNLIKNLDRYEEILEKRLYTIKSYLDPLPRESIPLEYYDLKKQELHFPFDKFFQDLKMMIDTDEDKKN